MKEIIKKRTIRVDGMTCEGCENNINQALSELGGVQEVKANKSGEVYVEYDLMKVKLETIENKIEELNYVPNPGFFDRLKDGFIHFTEQNEHDNMCAEPHSCCTLPSERVRR